MMNLLCILPMVIMVTTYALTIHHLKKQKLCALAGQRHVLSKNGTHLPKDSGTYSADSRATLTTSYMGRGNGHKDSFTSVAGAESTHRQVLVNYWVIKDWIKSTMIS